MDYTCNLIMVYDFEHDKLTDYKFSDKIKVGIFEDFEIDFLMVDISR